MLHGPSWPRAPNRRWTSGACWREGGPAEDLLAGTVHHQKHRSATIRSQTGLNGGITELLTGLTYHLPDVFKPRQLHLEIFCIQEQGHPSTGYVRLCCWCRHDRLENGCRVVTRIVSNMICGTIGKFKHGGDDGIDLGVGCEKTEVQAGKTRLINLAS